MHDDLWAVGRIITNSPQRVEQEICGPLYASDIARGHFHGGDEVSFKMVLNKPLPEGAHFRCLSVITNKAACARRLIWKLLGE